MFSGFAGVWTPALLGRRLKRKPTSVTIAGEKLVVFRDRNGAAAALLDRCPHRGASLSLGKVGDDGCIACPFHGWRFDGNGANCHVPLNPDAKRAHLGTVSVPVKELGDFIWIYTAPVLRAPVEPVVPDSLIDDRLTRVVVERTWRCHWTRAMENMLDSPHLPFVHASTIGRPLKKKMTSSSRMEVAWDETDYGGRQTSTLDGEGGLAHLDFYRPNIMELFIPIPDKTLRILALVVPVDERTTRLYVVGARSFMRPRVLNPMFALTNGFIADQDRAVVESSDPPVVPPAHEEKSVATDRATLAFRRYYFASLATSHVEPSPRLHVLSPRAGAGA